MASNLVNCFFHPSVIQPLRLSSSLLLWCWRNLIKMEAGAGRAHSSTTSCSSSSTAWLMSCSAATATSIFRQWCQGVPGSFVGHDSHDGWNHCKIISLSPSLTLFCSLSLADIAVNWGCEILFFFLPNMKNDTASTPQNVFLSDVGTPSNHKNGASCESRDEGSERERDKREQETREEKWRRQLKQI